jgi:hypothetical protein
MRRLVGAGAAALLCWAVTAPPAPAQTAVEGGGGFNDAPLLAPGAYSDRIQGGEGVYWAFEVGSGQQFAVTAVVGTLPGLSGFAGLTLTTHSPDRKQLEFDTDVFNRTSAPSTLTVRPQAARESGQYFAALRLNDNSNFRGRDFPVTLTIEVTGTPVTSATATATTFSTATTAGGKAASDAKGDRSLWPERLAGAAGGAVVGSLAVVLLARRRSRALAA